MSKRSDKEQQDQYDLKISQDKMDENYNSMAGGLGISTSNKHKNYCAAGLKQNFHATEMEAAQHFDDVIFQYDNEKKNGIIYRFLQAKHKYNETKKIKKGDLREVKKDGEFSLIKYFRSYSKIIQNVEFKDNSEFKDFIICTNIDLEEELQDHFERIKDADDILDMKLTGKDQKRLKFKEGNFSYKVELIEHIKKHTTDESINKEVEIQSFLEKLVFAVNLPNEIELGEIIENEIGETFNDVDKKNVYSRFQQKMLDWMSKKDGEFMSHEEGKSFFEKLKNEILGDIWFDVIDPVTLFTGRTEELKKLHETVQRSQKGTVVSQTTTVSGLGGIGKTELVRKYAKTYGTIYNNVVWINAEQKETLEQSFFELAKHNKLCIPTQDKDGKDKKIETIVKEIYDFFSKKKSLFIFDNVDKNYELNKFLPIYLSTADANRPYILITSRIQEWEEGIEIIKLHEMELSDGIEFVKKGLNIPIDDKLKNQEIEDLVKKLQCFPLAIQQAISFIKDKRVTQKFEINEYLKLYEQMDIINAKSIENDFTKVTFNTWKITIDKIQADPDTQCGQLAMKILDIASYLAPENIYRYIFLNLADGSEKLLNSAVRLLVKYSMVNGEEYQSVLNIHRIVQQVTRINIKDQNKEEQIVTEAIQLLDINFPSGSKKVENYKKKRDLIPHLEIFLSHIDNLIDQKPANKKMLEKYYTANLLNWIWEVYHNFGEIHKKKVLIERCIKLNEKYYGPDHYLVDRATEYQSRVYGELGEYQKEVELLERVLKSREKKYGPDNLVIARTLSKLGITYGYLGQYQKKADLFERVLTIDEKHHDPENFAIAFALIGLASAYGGISDHQKQNDCLERALKIIEMHYGPNNNEMHFGCDTYSAVKALEQLGKEYGNLGNLQKQKELLEKALTVREKKYGPDNFVVAKTLEDLAMTYGDLGDAQKQKESLERALKINEMHYGTDNINVANTLENLGSTYGTLGDDHKKKELLERALTIRKKYYGPDHIIDDANTLEDLANAYGTLGDSQKEKELLERALKINEMHYGTDNINVANTLKELGIAYGTLGDAKKEKKLLERALTIKEKHYGRDHIKVANILEDLANAYGTLGDSQKQKELLERSLKINEIHYGTDHFNVAKTLEDLALTYGDLGDGQKQTALLERALKINEMHYGTDNINVANTLKELGIAYGTLGDAKKEKKLLERALTIREKHYGPDHIIDEANTLEDLANAYGTLGDSQKEKELLERALKINEFHYGTDHFNVASTLEELAMTYGDLGDAQKQKELLERALRIKEMHYGPEHIFVANILENIGYANDTLADAQKQKEFFERALAITENHYGLDHIDVAYILEGLRSAYGTLGDAQKEKDLLERALKIKELYYGSDNINVTETLEHLGNVYGTLGLHHKAYELYEKSSGIIEKQTPLHLAASSGNLQTVEYILEKGADFLARNSHDTVLHQAISSGKEEVILLILKNIQEKFNGNSEQMYESINAKDTDGDTPLMWAAEKGNINAAKILLDYGADINAVDFDGQTALHEAVENGYLDFVQLLLKNYADHTVIDNNKKTPLNLAQEKFAQDLENKNLEEIVGILSVPDKNNIQQQNE